MNLKKFILLISGLLLIIGAVLAYTLYSKVYKPNTIAQGELYIPTGSNFEDVQQLVRPFLKRVKPFTWVGELKKYDKNIKAGKYVISLNMSNNDLVNLLRSGQQTPVMLSFNNQDTFEKLAGRISQQTEADSVSLLNVMLDAAFLKDSEFNKQTALGMYIPNTYEFFWNTNAIGFRDRMQNEYNRFWNSQRKQLASNIKLSNIEVITLASIVQKETAQTSERKRVAGLYLNRLRDGWPLQADPTIIFALKKEFGESMEVRRVLMKDLKINSPYNTYKHAGLPPGPIAMPDISSIDAVLNAEKHDFYYMCASVKSPGLHEFASTLSAHNRNARIYQKWISEQGINR